MRYIRTYGTVGEHDMVAEAGARANGLLISIGTISLEACP